MSSINLLPNGGMETHFGMLYANQRVSWESELFTDLTFIIQGQHFKCHQYLFASISPFLRELFQKLSSCTGHTNPNVMITLDGIDNPDILKDFLKFAYAGEVDRQMGRVEVSKFMEMMKLLGIRDVSMNISEVSANNIANEVSEIPSLHSQTDLQQPYALRSRKSNSTNTEAPCRQISTSNNFNYFDQESTVRNTCFKERYRNDSQIVNLESILNIDESEKISSINESEYTNIKCEVEDGIPTYTPEFLNGETSISQDEVLLTTIQSQSISRKRSIPNQVIITKPKYKFRKSTNPEHDPIIGMPNLVDERDESIDNDCSSKVSSRKGTFEDIQSNCIVEEDNNFGDNTIGDRNSVISSNKNDCTVDNSNNSIIPYDSSDQDNINNSSLSFNKDLSNSKSEFSKKKKVILYKPSPISTKFINVRDRNRSNITIGDIVIEEVMSLHKQSSAKVNKCSNQEIVQIQESSEIPFRTAIETKCKSCENSKFDSMQDLKVHLEKCQKELKKLNLKMMTKKEIEVFTAKSNFLDDFKMIYFVCSLCYTECSSRRAFELHIAANHYKSKILALNTKSLRCDRCAMCFFHSDLLAHHLAFYHDEVFKLATNEMKSILKSPKKFIFEHKCEECLKVFNSIDSHSRHMNYFHSVKQHTQNISNIVKESVKTNDESAVLTKTVELYYLACPYCFNLMLNSDHELDRHVAEFHTNNKTPSRKRTCLHCGEICIDDKKLRYHVEQKHKNLLKINCSICNEIFMDTLSLRTHTNLKHKSKDAYSCPYCHTFKCGEPGDLITHIALLHYKDRLINFINNEGIVPSNMCYSCHQTKENEESLLIHCVKEHNALDSIFDTNSKEYKDFKISLQNSTLNNSTLQPSSILRNCPTIIEEFVCPFCHIRTLLNKKAIIRHLMCHLREKVGRLLRLSYQRNYKCRECDMQLDSLWIIYHYIHVHKWWKYIFSKDILHKFFICQNTGKFMVDIE
ncbi:uncharacterized protein [Lepeophtheirus salmonis]|uniref:uncharacterized protein n=1 Tax=Lepeophtheirus salmonis TaxID=72036 RepID=UPI001AE9B11B|nr:zinc finger autosomal protein-like [Lepeophtheirus salmonis]XP_040566150.1 zinc finger autosomal protein-like [Lepeophtheirus salmonis]